MIVIIPAESIFSLKVHDFQSPFFQESAQLKRSHGNSLQNI